MDVRPGWRNVSVWRCEKCGATVAWIYDHNPGCPYCKPKNEGGQMQRVEPK